MIALTGCWNHRSSICLQHDWPSNCNTFQVEARLTSGNNGCLPPRLENRQGLCQSSLEPRRESTVEGRGARCRNDSHNSNMAITAMVSPATWSTCLSPTEDNPLHWGRRISVLVTELLQRTVKSVLYTPWTLYREDKGTKRRSYSMVDCGVNNRIYYEYCRLVLPTNLLQTFAWCSIC